MTAEEVKQALYGRHEARAYPMPGPWTCIEEYRSIDFLAFSAWSSKGGYRRIGYEVKVSRSDLRNELLNPSKRALNVAWCHEFYLAVPAGLLTKEELAYKEPEWEGGDFLPSKRCPGLLGVPCESPWSRKIKTHKVYVPVPVTRAMSPTHGRWGPGWTMIPCPTCKGKGYVVASRVECEAPTCWVPRDLGLVVCGTFGTRMLKRSPLRREVPMLSDNELGGLIRWVSIRPDPRHSSRNGRVTADERGILPASTKGE